jgi:transcriptional regulator with XRE-family HTH domain
MILHMDAKLTPAEAVRLMRERAGLTQYEAQMKLGIRQANLLCRIELGKFIPDAKLAGRIERLFNIPASSWIMNKEAA